MRTNGNVDNAMVLGNEDYFSGLCSECRYDGDNCVCEANRCDACEKTSAECCCAICDSCGDPITHRYYSVSCELKTVPPDFFFETWGTHTRFICRECQCDMSGRDAIAGRQA